MPRILFIDAYDSFSNNIITLLRAQLDASVDCIRIDDARFLSNHDAFITYLATFDGVVAGPGPGHPCCDQDVGLIRLLWNLPEISRVPVLGICLGFQSLCLAAGARVVRLNEPRHGRVARLKHARKALFREIEDVVVTQYHSLCVALETPSRQIPEKQSSETDGHEDEDEDEDESESLLWKTSEACPDLEPLAWAREDAENGLILMAVKWRGRPFWGVQYHPESICTNESGAALVRNWWNEVVKWRSEKKLCASIEAFSTSDTPSTLSWTSELTTPENEASEGYEALEKKTALDEMKHESVLWTSWPATQDSQVDVLVEQLCSIESTEPMLLESGVRDGRPLNSETGRYSIIGLPDRDSLHFKYYSATSILEQSRSTQQAERQTVSVQDVFGILQEFMVKHRSIGGCSDLPFWGGLVGFVGYEAGLQTIDVVPHGTDATRPDLWFVFVERSIVVDHVQGRVYAQSIRGDDQAWLGSLQALLNKSKISQIKLRQTTSQNSAVIRGPCETKYCQAVRTCQDHLRAGSSYELCLTDQTFIHNDADSWTIYKSLRKANPAPFGCHLNLRGRAHSDSIQVVGSSPERFLSWSRDGRCQFRPIKGTVKKVPGVTRQDADATLNSDKERAENLMIVDLIRHDLSGVVGYSFCCFDLYTALIHTYRIEDVHVPKLMVVEEYETVYQLVSVIEGTMTTDPAEAGIAVLARSLPPGSMTGAPKKRSCQLLCDLERREPRGLYSGVLGYFDVGGGGDFSVVIRTAFKWEGEGVWRIGAGGAVTALSEAKAEWEEMLAKRERVLDVLRPTGVS